MFIDELKCIEILYNNVYYGHDLKTAINKEYEQFGDFKKTILNLFNLQSINILLHTYANNPSFNIEHFLHTGIISNKYHDRVETPKLDPYYQNKPSAFYEEMVKSLKEGNYTFSDTGNVIVSSELIEAEIPSEWLYRLAQTYKNEIYQEIFMYNKNRENNITDENSLIDYLHQTKLFSCKLRTSVPNINLKSIFNNAKNKVTLNIKKDKELRVNDLISSFKDNLDSQVNCDITKIKLDLSLITMLVKKANYLGMVFYSKPLKEQKKFINNWLIEHLNGNIKANEIMQIYLLKLLQGENDKPKENINSLLISLINTYLIILSYSLNDFSDITISDFKITTYMNENLQNYLSHLQEIIKKLNSENNLREESNTINEIEILIQQIKQLDMDEDSQLIEQKNKELIALFDKHAELGNLKTELMSKRNTLQNLIHYEQENSLQEIAFDNDFIMSLLMNSIYQGQVYINPLDKDEIIFCLSNPELGKTVFQAKISIKKALNMITNNNMILEKHNKGFN